MAARAERGPWLPWLAWVVSLAMRGWRLLFAQALELGSTDIAAIRHLLMSDQLQHAAAAAVEIGALSAYERPLPTMAQYDQLLSGAANRGAAMSMETASIAQHCKWLHLSSIGTQFASLAEEARQQNHSHLRYLDALLGAEVEERERRSIELRLKDAHLPRIKTLEEFDFAQSPHIPASRIRALAEGSYLARAEPVLLIGEPGTGKSHLATGLAIAACRQRRRVRFITAAALVNQLVEAQREQTLSRMLARWARIELIVLDELGYVPLAEVAAELLFQVIADRAEKAAIIVTTNLPFSEWPQVFTNARLCKAVLDRLTDQAHIIETGSESYRFRQNTQQEAKAVVRQHDAA